MDNDGLLQNQREKMIRGIRHEKKDEIPWHWGSSNSVEEGKLRNYLVLRGKEKQTQCTYL